MSRRLDLCRSILLATGITITPKILGQMQPTPENHKRRLEAASYQRPPKTLVIDPVEKSSEN